LEHVGEFFARVVVDVLARGVVESTDEIPRLGGSRIAHDDRVMWDLLSSGSGDAGLVSFLGPCYLSAFVCSQTGKRVEGNGQKNDPERVGEEQHVWHTNEAENADVGSGLEEPSCLRRS